jgi:hypothetical protein
VLDNSALYFTLAQYCNVESSASIHLAHARSLEQPRGLLLQARRNQSIFSYIFSKVYTIQQSNACHVHKEIASPDGRDIIGKGSLANFRPDDISSPMKGILIERRKHGNTTIFFHLSIIPQSARQAKLEGLLAG